MARTKPLEDQAPWTSSDAAWDSVRVIVGNDAVAVDMLVLMESVWSKGGQEAYSRMVRELGTILERLKEFGPKSRSLHRRIPALQTAVNDVQARLGPASTRNVSHLPEALARVAPLLSGLESHIEKVIAFYAGTAPRTLVERPTDLVQAMKALAKRVPAVSPLLTARGLAIYEIATRRGEPCSSEHDFTDVREARWKKNLQRARRGT